ncbi:uncharacterized protein [Antedon mediterranea]|uniref:uncharacterized protein n=1 Tax=Antedon mediterranea TaxID=105859 RepID=UPI003AF46C01
MALYPAAICFLVAILVIGVHSEVATFNMGGVTGNITFTSINGGVYTIVTALSGLAGTYSWGVHQFPMFYNIKSPCSAVGNVVHSFSDESGTLLSSVTNQPLTSTLNEPIVDRSLVLSSTTSGDRICAHIHRDTSDVMTAVAKFQEPFAGTIMLRQDASDSTAITTVFVDLYDTVMPIEAATYNWRVAEFTGDVDFDMSPEMICNQVISSEPYNPTNKDACNQTNLSNCSIGDLTGKFNALTVQPIHSIEKQFFDDTNLPLSGSNSVIQQILVLENGNARSCAYIRTLLSKQVTTFIDADNVQGLFNFRQNSPLDYTRVDIHLNNMQNLAGGYHIHEFPVPQRFSAEDQICSGDSVSGHFNPYNVEVGSTYPAPTTATLDMYELGDLSGKYGDFVGLDSVNETYMDWNLPLFGRNSVIGRSIVIHFSADGARWVCSTIGYPGEVKTVYGQFQTPVVGSIIFRQMADDPLSDTSVFIDVAYGNGSPATHDHNWHVHIAKVGGDMISDTGVCKSCEGHANPFNVYLDEYSNCNPNYPMRCEVGDLAGKHGRITIADSMNTKEGRFFATDVQLPLSGFGSIDAMSMVIHTPDAGAPRFACTDIHALEPKVICTSMWTDGPATGEMRFTQESLYDRTTSEIRMENLGMEAGGYHVHLLPVPMEADSPCSPASVQGHFNPFNSVIPTNGTDDMFEVGDLSSKYDSFAGKETFDRVYHDSNLYLFGPQSIVGRSIVIHRDDETASRWMCSSLEQKLPAGAFQIEVESKINSNTYSGYIKMSQVHYGTGLLSDTTIELSLAPIGDYVEDTEIAWQIISNYGFDKCVKNSDNSDKTYNPYVVDDSKESYNTECGLSSHVRCTVGDLTRKHGYFSTTLKRAIFNDVNLDLSGRAAVIGHDLYLTDASNNNIYCGILEPTYTSGKLTSLTFPQKDIKFDEYDFRKTISDNIASLEMWQIVATIEPVRAEREDCITVQFWILGENREQIVRDINDAEYEVGLGKYSQTDICNSAFCTVSSLFSIIMLIFSSIILKNP